jgi:nucleotide-binding universal stress UspA family protein
MTRQMVLLAYDGSSAAQRALQQAAKLVGRGGEVAVVHVIAIAESLSSRLETVGERELEQQEAILREARAKLARRGVKARLIEAVGDPTREILAAAQETKAQTIVLGRSERRHLAHRSLASRLERSADSNVLIVH